MPAISPERRSAAARVGSIVKNRGADDPELATARQELRAAEAAELAQRIREIIDQAPPLTPAQRDRIAALLPETAR